VKITECNNDYFSSIVIGQSSLSTEIENPNATQNVMNSEKMSCRQKLKMMRKGKELVGTVVQDNLYFELL
jgi:hypothetical protein